MIRKISCRRGPTGRGSAIGRRGVSVHVSARVCVKRKKNYIYYFIYSYSRARVKRVPTGGVIIFYMDKSVLFVIVPPAAVSITRARACTPVAVSGVDVLYFSFSENPICYVHTCART